MSDLVVIGFDNEHAAFEMRAALVKLQKEYLIEMEDVVVVTKDENDKVKLHQAVNLTASGARCASMIGDSGGCRRARTTAAIPMARATATTMSRM